MRIAALSTGLNNGGAAKVAYTLSTKLSQAGVDISHITEDDVNQGLPRTIRQYYHKLRRGISSSLLSVASHESNVYRSLSIFSSPAISLALQTSPDIIHLHWVQGEFLSIEDIGKIKVPVVWTLHDSWPFSSFEHHQLDDHYNYPINYNRYPWWSLLKHTYSRKLKAWANSNFHFVAPSAWIQNKCQQSYLCSSHPCHLIQNPVDLSIFKPADADQTNQLKSYYHIDPSDKVLLVGSLAQPDDPIKGIDLLNQALACLIRRYTKTHITLVTLGTFRPSVSAGFTVIQLGKISDPRLLSTWYSTADVTCIPSRIETHSMTACESIACGTPVAAFNCSGNPSVISGCNGYLAAPFHPDRLAEAIIACFALKSYQRISGAIAYSARKWDSQTVASQYLSLYRRILE